MHPPFFDKIQCAPLSQHKSSTVRHTLYMTCSCFFLHHVQLELPYFSEVQRKLCVAKQTVTIIVVSFSLLFSGDQCLDLLLPHHLRNHRTRRFVMPTSSEILAGSSAPSGTNMERLCRSCTPRRIPCYLKTSPRPVLQRHRPRQMRFPIDGPPVKAVPESFRKRPTPPSSPVPECM